MSLPQILSQLSGGMVRTVGIFFSDADLFSASGPCDFFWPDGEKSGAEEPV